MTNKQDDADIPWWQKALALGIVGVVAVLILAVLVAVGGGSTDQDTQNSAIQGCGNSRFSSETDCPESDYSSDSYAETDQYSDKPY